MEGRAEKFNFGDKFSVRSSPSLTRWERGTLLCPFVSPAAMVPGPCGSVGSAGVKEVDNMSSEELGLGRVQLRIAESELPAGFLSL